MYDYVIIGAGIIGTCVARELSRYSVKAIVLEKENDVANVQTLANSAIIHSGHNPEPDSLKAKLNIWGNQLYDELEQELDIPLLRSGAYVVAHNEQEEAELEKLYQNALANEVPDVALLSFEEAVKTEPNLARSITKVLTLPTTKVTYPWEVAFACMENAMKNGMEFQKNATVTKIEPKDDFYIITVNNRQTIETKAVINAAGVASDDIAAMIDKTVEFKITPRKGEYFVLDNRMKGFVNHVLYPLPSEAGKGVLLTPQVHGEILVGPNSVYVEDKYRTDVSFEGLNYVKANAGALAENVPFHKIIRSFAGIRATSTYDDFYIQESKEHKGIFHFGGLESPGLSAAPAIAKYLLRDVIHIEKLFPEKPDFDPIRKKKPEFHTFTLDEKRKLIEEYPTYGNIICKCEQITEKEIVDAIHAPLGSNTIKGLKKRTRAGAGLCQGGYCEEKVMKLIARETGVSPLTIAYDATDSALFLEETKVEE
ncbi:MAG: NAD(P)/FAD-dependent oxidoreductase [Bacilli bacterium]|nr:NAD(P)/FAD-dependent oxidoreductase [Bacilli bacterium]MBN2876576.1 NAD(P)/FAD-dependent oxidoreductase [Bacilli bacterium]